MEEHWNFRGVSKFKIRILDFKMLDFEIHYVIGSSGPSHSIRLVESLWMRCSTAFSNISFEVKKLTFEGCSKTRMTFTNVLEYSRVIPAWFYIKFQFFKGNLMKIDENQEESDFNTKSLTSIPFGGPICTGCTKLKTWRQKIWRRMRNNKIWR